MIESIKFVGGNTQAVIDLMTEAQKVTGDLKVTIQPWSDKRTLSANAQIHVWYSQIAKKDGEDVNTVANFCKLTFGLPILMSDPTTSKKIGFMLDKIGFYQFTHEQQCNVMTLLAVTSIMSSKQHSEYRDNLLSYYNKQGYRLDYMT